VSAAGPARSALPRRLAGSSGVQLEASRRSCLYADSNGKEVEVPTWTEIEIIDHGRDIITAVMNVNCRYEYRFKTNLGKADIVDSLKDLKQLRDEGELSKTQYERAKESLLRSDNP
jgi:hypothetical protein